MRCPVKDRIALSLFSGAGGFDIGVSQAGFTVLAEVELDKHCCSTLRTNASREGRLFGQPPDTGQPDREWRKTRVLEKDIRLVEPVSLRNDLRLEEGQLDLLFGGPPCQSFSLAGKQLGLNDDRGLLLFQMARFARVFKPKVILIEQVKGLLSAKGNMGRRGEVFTTFLDDLEAAGYTPKWKVIIAADHGVAQLRERLFVVATAGRNGFFYPERSHVPLGESSALFPLPPYRTVGDVLVGLGKPKPKIPRVTMYANTDSHVDVTPERDRERIHQVPEGSYLACQMHVGEEIRRGLSPKDTTKYLRVHRKRPANTLRCGEIFYHPTEDRYLTPREYMRIHGYPDEYTLEGPIRSRTGTVRDLDQHRQVANSVPPPVAKALAMRIMEHLNEQNL